MQSGNKSGVWLLFNLWYIRKMSRIRSINLNVSSRVVAPCFLRFHATGWCFLAAQSRTAPDEWLYEHIEKPEKSKASQPQTASPQGRNTAPLGRECRVSAGHMRILLGKGCWQFGKPAQQSRQNVVVTSTEAIKTGLWSRTALLDIKLQLVCVDSMAGSFGVSSSEALIACFYLQSCERLGKQSWALLASPPLACCLQICSNSCLSR